MVMLRTTVTRGVLLAFTMTAVVPPVPAWALRQETVEAPDTQAGLEEGLKKTTLNRREFLRQSGKVVAATVGGAAIGAGLAAATSLDRPATGQKHTMVVPVVEMMPSARFTRDVFTPRQFKGHGQLTSWSTGELAYAQRPDGSREYSYGRVDLELSLGIEDAEGRIVERPGDHLGYAPVLFGAPVSVRVRFRGVEGIDRMRIWSPGAVGRMEDILVKKDGTAEATIDLRGRTPFGNVRIPLELSFSEDSPGVIQRTFGFTVVPDEYTYEPREVDAVATASAIGAAAVGGGLAAGVAALFALAPADAEKVLAELVSTAVGDVKSIAETRYAVDGQELVVFVSEEVADRSTVFQSGPLLQRVPGYPRVVVTPMSERGSYQSAIAEGRAVYLVRWGEGSPSSWDSETVYVTNLNGQPVGSPFPAVVTEALARWRRANLAAIARPLPAPIMLDITPYWALRDLPFQRVEEIVYEQFA